MAYNRGVERPISVTISVTIRPVPSWREWAEGPDDLPEWESLEGREYPCLIRIPRPAPTRRMGALAGLLEVARSVLEGVEPPENPRSETRQAILRVAQRAGVLDPDGPGDTLQMWIRASAHVWALHRVVEAALWNRPLPRDVGDLPDEDRPALELLATSSNPLRREFYRVARHVIRTTGAFYRLKGNRLRQALLLDLARQHPGFQVQPGRVEVEVRGGVFHVALVELSHQLQHRRKVRVCAVCSQRFLARGGAKTCSPKCRQALSRLQRRSKAAEPLPTEHPQ